MLPKKRVHRSWCWKGSGVGSRHSKSTSSHLCSVPTRFPVQRLAAELLNFKHFISASTLGVQSATKSCMILSPNHRESVSDLSDIHVLVAMDRHAIGCPQGNHLTLNVQVIPSTRWVLPSPSTVAFMANTCHFYDSAQDDPALFLMHAWYFLSV